MAKAQTTTLPSTFRPKLALTRFGYWRFLAAQEVHLAHAPPTMLVRLLAHVCLAESDAAVIFKNRNGNWVNGKIVREKQGKQLVKRVRANGRVFGDAAPRDFKRRFIDPVSEDVAW